MFADLAIAITPKSYVRVTLMAHAATPLAEAQENDAGYGKP